MSRALSAHSTRKQNNEQKSGPLHQKAHEGKTLTYVAESISVEDSAVTLHDSVEGPGFGYWGAL
jgi:hypothetical protein